MNLGIWNWQPGSCWYSLMEVFCWSTHQYRVEMNLGTRNWQLGMRYKSLTEVFLWWNHQYRAITVDWICERRMHSTFILKLSFDLMCVYWNYISLLVRDTIHLALGMVFSSSAALNWAKESLSSGVSVTMGPSSCSGLSITFMKRSSWVINRCASWIRRASPWNIERW